MNKEMNRQKRIVIISLILAAILMGILIGQTSTLASADAPDRHRALIISDAGQNIDDVRAALETNGAHVTHAFPPDALIVTLTGDFTPNNATTYFGTVDPASTAGWSATARQAAAIWNALLTPETDVQTNTVFETHPDDPIDSFEAPEPQSPELLAKTADDLRPEFRETSQFFIGSVAVGIVLPESMVETVVDGQNRTENWTDEERAKVVSEIVNAMDWWAELEPDANISFVYDNIAANTTPTAREPITEHYYDQKYWIADAMDAMGYSSTSYFDQVRLYNNALRETHQTDWAFTIFVVDSSVDSDNRFSDGYFAYAYLGGPFMVMTSGNNGYGPNYMDAVTAHETGHIFRALDQYASANQGCSKTAGYLGVENQNSQLGCSLNEASIMRGQISPYTNKQIDVYARGQIGWADSNKNGILDPVDVGLDVSGVSSTEGAYPNILTFNGQLTETPFASPLYRSILINKIESAAYRVDDGGWLSVFAADGTFDSYQEAFTFTTDPLPGGTHTIYLKTVDNFGKVNEATIATVTVVDPAESYVETEFSTLSAQSFSLNRNEDYTFSGMAYQLNGGYVMVVEYRIDGGAWQPVAAADGTFDGNTEAFSVAVDTETLSAGNHTVQARTIDNLGYIDSSPASITVNVESGTHTVFLPMVIRN